MSVQTMFVQGDESAHLGDIYNDVREGDGRSYIVTA